MPYGNLIWPMLGFFGALVLAGAGFPIPEELPTIGAGIWVASNPQLSPFSWLVLPVCFAGVLISDVMLYGIGRLWGPRLLRHRWVAKIVPPDKRQKIERNFHRHGVKVLLAIRWLPGIRSPMFITAGMMRLKFVRFLLADGIALVVGHSLLFFLAWWFGDSFRALVERAEHRIDSLIKPLLVLLLVSAIAGYLLWHFLRYPVSTGDPDEAPPIIHHAIEGIEKREAAHGIIRSPDCPPDAESNHKPEGVEEKEKSAARPDGQTAPE